MLMKRLWLAGIFCFSATVAFAQVSQVWVADQGNGYYKNPVLDADYSDPDAIRVGDDYYMISSSFNHAPGLPVLHSRDLVNWKLIGHALQRQIPDDHFSKVQHGNGVWAPSIRYHKGEFYIYYPDPDFGIYLTKAKNILGPWSEPVMVMSGKGLIDPCPLWDDDGKTYLVYALAGSRAGIKSVLLMRSMNAAGTTVTGDAVLVYADHEQDPTIEGPKFYKRNGYYYIFAPAGGVSTGWQLVLRSKKINGPYERKVVMDRGSTVINGPHQGAWVDTKAGEHWFLHFQDKEAYGRVVHLQPMKWINDWPVIGEDSDGDGKGQPVMLYRKPQVGKTYPLATPPDSDEFNGNRLGLQWQWQANPASHQAFIYQGHLRMYTALVADSNANYWDNPSLLMQKFPAERFMATALLKFHPKLVGEKAGLIVFGADYSYIALEKTASGNRISFVHCAKADKAGKDKITAGPTISSQQIYLRVTVDKGAVCTFYYSEDGTRYTALGSFTARPGRWVGAKAGLFATRTVKTNDAGYADIDWFRVEPLL